VIVLTGRISEFARPLVDEIRDRVNNNIRIEVSDIIEQSGILGGGVELMYKALDYCRLQLMS
jgi:hypothetical protein